MPPQPQKVRCTVSIIAAVAENGVIGVGNALPWRLPVDLQRFRALTSGHHVLMGRKTCESLGRPLPERVNLVLSAQPDYAAEGFTVVHSIEAALALASAAKELFVIGGASIYAQTLARAQRMYLTLVHARIDGDTWFPHFDRDDWEEFERTTHAPDRQHAYAFTFLALRRRGIIG